MTKAYAEVIGDPIAHSKSPLIHGFWLEKLGIDADYRLAPVKAEDLRVYFAERRADPLWRGCNVTIPHKSAVFEIADRCEGAAQKAGAANCVTPDHGELVATNTDVFGFLEPFADVDFDNSDVIVIGAGGASRAVLIALALHGYGAVHLHNRDVEKAAALLEALGIRGEALPLDAPWASADLLVNASALGMEGYPPLPMDIEALPAGATVCDVVYTPLETPLLAAARAANLRAVDGLHMLIGQAGIAFEAFFGEAAPRQHDAELRELLTQ
jgi:shikimate dehydrogenase